MLALTDVKKRHMKKFKRYKNHLSLVGNNVFSYTTHVATIEGDNLRILGYWSKTTTKHVNYVASELGLKKV
jgi:hypothetical protein